jgi:WD40 repeat protein
MIGGDEGMVSTYDCNSHDLIDIWNVGAKITALACLSLEEGGFIVAAGTSHGSVVLRQDWEDAVPRKHTCCEGFEITDIVFSNDKTLMAVSAMNSFVYLFQFHLRDYILFASCSLEEDFPISLNFSEDSSLISVFTNTRKVMLVSVANFREFLHESETTEHIQATMPIYYKLEDVANKLWSNWKMQYPLLLPKPALPRIPLSLGNTSNAVICGDENGNIYIYKSVEDIRANVGPSYAAHTSSVQAVDFTLDDTRFISIGTTDRTLLQWTVEKL